MEEIIGGYPVSISNFRYHAAIIGKYNFSNSTNLMCSAGIITNYLLLSAARCFMYTHNSLRKVTFFAVVGTGVLVSKHLELKEIDQIYTYYFSYFGLKNDLAIAKLKESLYLEYRMDIHALELPDENEFYDEQIGVVAGFGIDDINDLGKLNNRELIRMSSKKNLILKSANVTIINSGEPKEPLHNSTGNWICNESSAYFNDICGVISSDETYDLRGLCVGDNGAPLVIGNKLVGIANKHRRDCDDTIHGTTYTKVSRFKTLIDALKEGRIADGTTVFDNPKHMLRMGSAGTSTS